MILKYAEWRSSITDLFQKNKKIRMGIKSGIKIETFKKHFATNRLIIIYDPEKQTEVWTYLLNNNNNNNGVPAKKKNHWIIIQKS